MAIPSLPGNLSMAKQKDVSVQKDPATTPSQRFDQQLERLFDDLFRRRWPGAFGSDWPKLSLPSAEMVLPRVDVVDKNDHLLVRAELPGMSKDDIEVSVSASTITVKGSVRTEAEQDEDEYHRREIFSQVVSRTVSLPSEVDADGATATLKDGMLEVSLPKVARARRKRIDVQS
jgi:HSP20 family protein